MKKIYPLILSVLIFLFYFPTFFYQFVGDDYCYLLKLETSRNIFTAFKFVWDPTVLKFYFRPLAWLPYFLGYLIDPNNIAWFHLLSIIFHLANCVLLYFVTKYFFKSDEIAFFSALIFGLHPVNSEVISSPAIFGDIAVTFFSILSLILFGLFCLRDNLKFYLLSLLLFIFSLLSKEAAFIVPFLIIFTSIAFYKIKKINFKNAKIFLPYFLITGFYFIFRPADKLNIKHLMPDVGKMSKLIYYIRDLAIPLEMNLLKRFIYENSFIGPFLTICFFIIILLIILFLRKFKKPKFYFPLIWIGFTLIIPILIPFAPARRHLYFPLLGFSIFIVVLFFQLIKKRAYAILALTMVLALLTFETYRRNQLYRFAGGFVHSALGQLRKDIPLDGGENLLILAGIPGIVDNTYSFWTSPEDKIRFIYKKKDLPVFCLSVFRFGIKNIPKVNYNFLDDFTFTQKMDTNLEEYFCTPYATANLKNWGEDKNGIGYKIEENDEFGNIKKITFRLPKPLLHGKKCFVIGWEENRFKLLKIIER